MNDNEQSLTENQDLEQLIQVKVSLEKESALLDQQQKEQELQAKQLCTQIIQKMKDRNSKKQLEIDQMRKIVEDLEDQLQIEQKIENTKLTNIEKQQEISHLQEVIAQLETQAGELAVSETFSESGKKNSELEMDYTPVEVYPIDFHP